MTVKTFFKQVLLKAVECGLLSIASTSVIRPDSILVKIPYLSMLQRQTRQHTPVVRLD